MSTDWLAIERAKRGLPPYAGGSESTPPPAPTRERLRALISAMVATDPTVTNSAIARAFGAGGGSRATAPSVHHHRRAMGLPQAPVGDPTRRSRNAGPTAASPPVKAPESATDIASKTRGSTHA